MDLRRLHQDHRAIIRIASDLIGVSREVRSRDDAEDARFLIEQLDRVLGLHLELEDIELYPALMGCDDARVVEITKDCAEDMGGLAEAWCDYQRQWPVEMICRNADRFAVVSRVLMEAVAQRVDREERELYPLAECLETRAA
ncbi:hemerythrin domain-containing protein [Brevundimonas nasdae]|uniref:hemerythrin domain-containing protein n=1 Tax=Brevundimonas nasdae TaxID=172043 RepID=UPI00289955AF|nr:hemerythrin domain-containing protein [Brevundimonas nasdae]